MARAGRTRGQGARHVEESLFSGPLRAFIEQGPLTVYINRPDPASSNIYMSPQLEAILGYTADEWRENPNFFHKVLHPDDRDWVIAEQPSAPSTG